MGKLLFAALVATVALGSVAQAQTWQDYQRQQNAWSNNFHYGVQQQLNRSQSFLNEQNAAANQQFWQRQNQYQPQPYSRYYDDE
ncbi:MAG: hypothetical protein JO105_23520 [Hyphomicrobiales bacterium]|nr:hypothetical protein [Hyphomicrobiales bacterium]MBV9978367.1 hypothetical protein [Hyphomicrobiales bacterium]